MAYEAFKSAKTHHEMIVTLMALRNTNLIPAIEGLIPHVSYYVWSAYGNDGLMYLVLWLIELFRSVMFDGRQFLLQ